VPVHDAVATIANKDAAIRAERVIAPLYSRMLPFVPPCIDSLHDQVEIMTR
jgi:hypothetical protein